MGSRFPHLAGPRERRRGLRAPGIGGPATGSGHRPPVHPAHRVGGVPVARWGPRPRGRPRRGFRGPNGDDDRRRSGGWVPPHRDSPRRRERRPFRGQGCRWFPSRRTRRPARGRREGGGWPACATPRPPYRSATRWVDQRVVGSGGLSHPATRMGSCETTPWLLIVGPAPSTGPKRVTTAWSRSSVGATQRTPWSSIWPSSELFGCSETLAWFRPCATPIRYEPNTDRGSLCRAVS